MFVRLRRRRFDRLVRRPGAKYSQFHTFTDDPPFRSQDLKKPNRGEKLHKITIYRARNSALRVPALRPEEFPSLFRKQYNAKALNAVRVGALFCHFGSPRIHALQTVYTVSITKKILFAPQSLAAASPATRRDPNGGRRGGGRRRPRPLAGGRWAPGPRRSSQSTCPE